MLAAAKCGIVESKSCLGGEQMWGKRSRRRRRETHRVKPEEREREGTKGQEGEKIDYCSRGDHCGSGATSPVVISRY